MIDNIANWASLIQTIVHGYAELVLPLSSPDYSSNQVPIVVHRLPVYRLNGRECTSKADFQVHEEVFANRRFKLQMVHDLGASPCRFRRASVFMALLWPLVLIMFLPPRLLGIKKEDTIRYQFQYQIWREQFQWLAIYVLTFVGLFIANAGLRDLAVATAK